MGQRAASRVGAAEGTPHALPADGSLAAAIEAPVTWLARHLPGRLFDPILDRIDAGLTVGRLTGYLPDGRVRVLGGRMHGPDVIVRLTDWRALVRLALSGSAGWYRAWARGEWDSPDRVALFALFMANARTLGSVARARGPWRRLLALLHARRRNDRTGARRNIAAHYDLGNDFYECWLDPSLTYSSAMWTNADASLQQAQTAKIDALLDRLDLRPGAALLEIGCGWGALGVRAIERRDVRYHGLTISAEQARVARARLAETDGVILEEDYRATRGKYDAIASVEMVEAVGAEYWSTYLDVIRDRLRPGGRAAIQFIAIDDALFDAYSASADFIQTHVFPGGCLVATDRFRALAEARGLAWRDEHRFGGDYARTLALWRRAFDQAVADGRLPARFDDRFIALWRYYLDYCEGGFTGGGIWVMQVTLEKSRT